MPLDWKSRPIPRFEYEDDRFYARVQEQHDHWEALLYQKVRSQRGAMLLESELLEEDRCKDEDSAKASVAKMIARARSGR